MGNYTKIYNTFLNNSQTLDLSDGAFRLYITLKAWCPFDYSKIQECWPNQATLAQAMELNHIKNVSEKLHGKKDKTSKNKKGKLNLKESGWVTYKSRGLTSNIYYVRNCFDYDEKKELTYTKISVNFIKNSGLNDGDFRLYVILKSYCWGMKNYCFPSLKELSNHCGNVSIQTISKRLARLQESKWISIKNRGNKTNLIYVYEINQQSEKNCEKFPQKATYTFGEVDQANLNFGGSHMLNFRGNKDNNKKLIQEININKNNNELYQYYLTEMNRLFGQFLSQEKAKLNQFIDNKKTRSVFEDHIVVVFKEFDKPLNKKILHDYLKLYVQEMLKKPIYCLYSLTGHYLTLLEREVYKESFRSKLSEINHREMLKKQSKLSQEFSISANQEKELQEYLALYEKYKDSKLATHSAFLSILKGKINELEAAINGKSKKESKSRQAS